jgi:hypothetical protein
MSTQFRRILSIVGAGLLVVAPLSGSLPADAVQRAVALVSDS